jgi:glyoxylase-like metal-dependent hydrolase (beta-lactamase superfamily II)
MEIVPGVHTIDSLGMGRAYLAIDADRVTIIDTGLKGSGERVLRAVQTAGRKPEDVRQIVISHHHGDHAGGLAELVERTSAQGGSASGGGAQVMVHALDAPVVRGERPPPGPSSGGLLKPLLASMSRPAPAARVDRELADGDEIDALEGIRVVHTPGHTPGSTSLYCAKRRLLFVGDAAANIFGLRPAIGWFTEDAARAKESLRKLAALDFEAVFFGHGRPIAKEAALRFRRFVEKLR